MLLTTTERERIRRYADKVVLGYFEWLRIADDRELRHIRVSADGINWVEIYAEPSEHAWRQLGILPSTYTFNWMFASKEAFERWLERVEGQAPVSPK